MSRKKGKNKTLSSRKWSKSFKKIRDQLDSGHSTAFKKASWVNNKNQYWFPYSERIKPLQDLCGKYEFKSSIPIEFSLEEDDDPFLTDTPLSICRFDCLCEFIKGITPEEFKAGKVSNTKLHNLLLDTELKGKIKKPKLVPIIDYFQKIDVITKDQCDTLTRAVNNRGSKKDSTYIYFSCDPWDIMRMGVGSSVSFGSCMNIVTRGCYSNKLPNNLQDSNMGVAYVEKDSDRGKVDGIMSRMIMRVLLTPIGYAAVFDRMYGEQSARPAMVEALKRACRKADVKFMEFSNYMPHIKNRMTVDGKGAAMWGSTNANVFKNQFPYMDNSSGCGYRAIEKNTKAGYALFKLVYDKDNQ